MGAYAIWAIFEPFFAKPARSWRPSGVFLCTTPCDFHPLLYIRKTRTHKGRAPEGTRPGDTNWCRLADAGLPVERQRVGGLLGHGLALLLQRFHEPGGVRLEGEAHQPMHEHAGA